MASLDEVLANIQPEDAVEVDFDNYKDQAEFPPPVPRGEYTLIQGKPEFDLTKDKANLKAGMNHKIVSPTEFDGRLLMFDRISTKVYDRDGSKASQFADHLRALGSKARPKGPKEWGEALAAGEGKPFKAILDVEASCSLCYERFKAEDGGTLTKEHNKAITVSGERNFPVNPATGGRLYSVPCPTCKAPMEGRNRIVRRIPA